MLDPTKAGWSGRIPGIIWNMPNGVDKLGVIAKSDGLLFFGHDDRGQLGQFFVPFVFTPTKFGGHRSCFRCPGCSQCPGLYGVISPHCRKCHGLKHLSQYDAPAFRLLNRAHNLRKKLWKPDTAGDPLPPKPHYMTWRTYQSRERRVSELESAGCAAMSARVNPCDAARHCVLRLDSRRRRIHHRGNLHGGSGLYGPPAFLHALHHARSWPVRLIGTAITVHFPVGAALLLHLDWDRRGRNRPLCKR
jgi:hypothetical protein